MGSSGRPGGKGKRASLNVESTSSPIIPCHLPFPAISPPRFGSSLTCSHPGPCISPNLAASFLFVFSHHPTAATFVSFPPPVAKTSASSACRPHALRESIPHHTGAQSSRTRQILRVGPLPLSALRPSPQPENGRTVRQLRVFEHKHRRRIPTGMQAFPARVRASLETCPRRRRQRAHSPRASRRRAQICIAAVWRISDLDSEWFCPRALPLVDIDPSRAHAVLDLLPQVCSRACILARARLCLQSTPSRSWPPGFTSRHKWATGTLRTVSYPMRAR
ncbi:hypothetical protein BD413DRAFT_238496 [Trametes elegans]|nr:hypothetical protein BD413DRAFT_238496 [Trametes elegans]